MLSSEDRRVNELFKYWRPHEIRRLKLEHRFNGDLPGSNNISQVDTELPDTTLTAICQLAALRLDVLRVGISLLSDRTQYILAESSTTRDLSDTNQEVMVTDGAWGGFVECNRKGGLCDLTISCPPATESNPFPCLTILDLRLSHVKDAPFVAGPPYMRFYCGTPITTDNGLRIGSFYAVHNKMLPEFSRQQKKLFSSLASLVMGQLEGKRETVERQKNIRMARALSDLAFVSTPRTLEHEGIMPETNEREHSHSRGSTCSTDVIDQNGSESSNKSSFRSGSGEDDETIYDDSKHVFSRSASLIRQALDVEGCIFFDCAEAVLAGVDPAARTDDPHNSEETDPARTSLQRRESIPDYLAALPSSGTPPVETLGFSINQQSTLHGDTTESAFSQLGITPFDEKSLLELIRKYPQGMLWSFGETDMKSNVPEKTHRRASVGNHRLASTGSPNDLEITLLVSRFPGIRHLVFVPLFDASLGRANAGCFVFTYQRPITFSAETELSFLRNFMNSMGAELGRLDAAALRSSQTKFIGSVSHELRSPLHGILAAAEFLEDTTLSNYQKSLISTQIACGRTLLHVIEHVLDYSKINNTFMKDEKSAGDGFGPKYSRETTSGTGMQNLYEQTDIAELVEEVVEGSVAGRTLTTSDVSLQLVKQESRTKEEPVYGFVKNVAVIVDLDFKPDWIYVTQPGAVRRILMNILGNSLKYTAAGCIRVRLKTVDQLDDPPSTGSRSVIQLAVSDTGKGISREFLRKRLFVAFQQEDHLSTGCGLGLSIVKSLVDGLGGKLEIKSEQHVGTTVTVKLPLSRGSEDEEQRERVKSETEPLMPLATMGLSVCYVGFFGFSDAVTEPIVAAREARIRSTMNDSISKCMVDWLGMTPITSNQNIDDADYVVILADERLKDFIEPYTNDMKKKQPRVIALIHSEMTRSTVEKALSANIKAFEIMSAPFGPRKVAMAVSACERAAETWSGRMRSHSRASLMKTESGVEKDVRNGTEILQETSVIAKPKTDTFKEKSEEKPEEKPEEKTGVSLEVARSHESRPVVAPLTTSEEDGLPLLQKRPVANNTQQPRRLLLVDDNQINVRLLETFVRKRRPGCLYDTAGDGLRAVEAVQRNESGYGIIFMDISMPVMDGLEATRKIREIEKDRRNNSDLEVQAPAVIVALTGLANSRDQSNAFASGVDLFMTKPAKFKEIGKLLDDFFK